MKLMPAPAFSTIAIVLAATSLISCEALSPRSTKSTADSSGYQTVVSKPTPTPPAQTSQPVEITPIVNPPAAPIPTEYHAAANLPDLEPKVGLIQDIQMGDLMCYITFIDEAGATQTVGATFEVCQTPKLYLHQRVRLVYGVGSVNNCTSNEPCGRSRLTHLVVRMDVVDRAGRNVSTDATVLQNGEWTITIGNRNSWSGVNGTGNLTYRGCNTNQDCIDLVNGVVSCRDGICSTTWVNGIYSYTLINAMREQPDNLESTLFVRRNSTLLRQITGLK
jgi:hypothetical protein